MNPKGLAPTRRMKKGGRAAVIPLGEVNPPPAPEGSEQGVLDRQLKTLTLKALIMPYRRLQISKNYLLAPL